MATAEKIVPQSYGAVKSNQQALPLPVLIYLIMVAMPFNINAGPVALSGVRAFLLIMIVPTIIKLFSGKYGRLVAADYFFLLHMGWAAIALVANNPDRMIQFVGSIAVEFLGGYVLARVYIRTPEAMMAVWKTLFIIIIVTLPLAMFESVTARPLAAEILGKIPGIQGLAKIPMEPRMGLNRAQVVFSHPIHYGLFGSVVFALCAVGMKLEWSNARRFLTTALICCAVFFSLSSGALLPVALQIALMIWAGIFRNLKARWVLLISLIILAYVVVDLASNRPPIRVFMSYATFSPHNAYWRGLIFEYGIQNVWDNPLFGIGLNDWVRPAWMHTSSVDNFWLLIAMQFGIPGFILLICGYLEILFRIARAKLDADPVTWRLRRAFMFSFIGLTLTLCTVHIWGSIYSFTFFLLGSGVWMIFAKADAPEDAPEVVETGASRSMRLSRGQHADSLLARSHTPNAGRETKQANLSRPATKPEKDRGDGVKFTRFSKRADAKRRP